jgi:hypothetical protein
MAWLFTLRDRFSPDIDPEAWQSYLDFSGFAHIDELVSADGILCGDVITTLIDEDWNFNIHADNRVTLFTDYGYLLRRVAFDPAQHNLLAIFEWPTPETDPPPPNFEPCGFDIIDSDHANSVLTNCGPQPEIVAPEEVNRFGLLPTLNRAAEAAQRFRTTFPHDPHCRDCRVWWIARYQSGTEKRLTALAT